jgi:HAD superfamily hydrolase (TIGR01509 family)
MDWEREYQLILFDFDGLLVNTEQLHHQAYINLCRNRGYALEWSFENFCKVAHYNSEGIRREIYRILPELHKQVPDWDILYAEKKQAYLDLVAKGAVQLMPGAHELLVRLQRVGANTCVVTHSAAELVNQIRQQHPILGSIKHWMTREDYSKPKPAPDCYHEAIKRYAAPQDAVLGFEDTPRGIRALIETSAKAVMVASIDYPEIPEFIKHGVTRVRSLLDVLTIKGL